MAKRRVLIPLDGSDFRWRIVPIVRQLFDPCDTELVLLRIAPLPYIRAATQYHYVYPGEMVFLGCSETQEEADQLHKNSRVELETELQQDVAQLRDLGYSAYARIRFGDPAQKILEYVQHVHVDLIAMATRYRSGLSRFFLGSVAEQVLQKATVPVILLREQVQLDGNQSYPAQDQGYAGLHSGS